jgi:hypothetical protein
MIDRDGSGLHRARDKATIKRLQMYSKGGKAKRWVGLVVWSWLLELLD